jgi:hypothetical protein
MKKMVMVCVCVMLLSVLAIGSESNATTANPDWYNVTIQSCGAVGGLYFVFCTSVDSLWTGQRMFLMDATNAANKSLLASALTGQASGGAAALYMPGGVPPAGSFIVGIGAGNVQ